MAMAMIELINALTGTRMFVTLAREAEYLAAGHTRDVYKRQKYNHVMRRLPSALRSERNAPGNRGADLGLSYICLLYTSRCV